MVLRPALFPALRPALVPALGSPWPSGGGASGPELATKATAYEPAEVGANDTPLRSATGWGVLPGSVAYNAGHDLWRTYTGGQVGTTGDYGWTPYYEEIIVGRDTGSADHVFRCTIDAWPGSNSGISIMVASSGRLNCVWLEAAVWNNGVSYVELKKRDATGVVSLGSYGYQAAEEVGRTSLDDSINKVLRIGDTIELQVLGQRVHAFINGKRVTAQEGADLDTTRPFTKGTYCGFGVGYSIAGMRLSDLYMAPLTHTLSLRSTSLYADFQRYWPGLVGSGRKVPVHFNYTTTTGAAPTGVQYRLVHEDTNAVYQDWATLSGGDITIGAPSSGAGTGTAMCSVPMVAASLDPRYRIQLRCHSDVDARTMTSHPVTVGYTVGIYGQSNAIAAAGADAVETNVNDLVFCHDPVAAGWRYVYKALGTSAEKTARLGDVLLNAIDYPVGTYVYGVGAQSIAVLSGKDEPSDATSLAFPYNGGGDDAYFDNLEAHMAWDKSNVTGYIQRWLWVQGEAEARTASPGYPEATYRALFDTLLSRLRAVSASPEAEVGVTIIGSEVSTPSGGLPNDAAYGNQRRTLFRLADKAGVYISDSLLDIPMIDSLHYTAAGQQEHLRRAGHSMTARCAALGLGTSSGINGRGPTITGATRSGSTITLAVSLNGATGISGTGLTLYEVNTASDFTGTSYTVSSAAVSGSNIELTLGSAPAGPVYVRSHWHYDLHTSRVNAIGSYADGTTIAVEPIYTALTSN
jgi:hypothetical protein